MDEDELHSVLKRQARRAGVEDLFDPPDAESWTELLERVSRTYESADRDRYLLERSLDVSSQEMQELSAQLRREKEILVAVLGALSTGIVHLDAEWNVQFLNPAGRRLLHAYAENESVGVSFFDLIGLAYSDGRTIERTEIEPVLEGEQPWWEDDAYLTRPDDSTLPVSVVFNPMHHADDLVGVVVTVTDISEKKRAAREIREARVEAAAAERARRAQAAFLANMSHELRTPLNAIIGYSELVCEDAEDFGYDEVVPDLNKIRSAGRHLLSIINDVLDMSKIQAGRMELDIDETDVAAVLEDLPSAVGSLIDRNDNELVVEVGDVPTIETDETRLRQAVVNLLANAAKFTHGGTITLRATTTQRDGVEHVAVEVEDTGIGIEGERVEQLFGAFEQADSSTTRKYGGTGLGLTITKSICAALGATIEVDSELDVGSTFRIVLPFRWSPPTLEERSEIEQVVQDVEDDALEHEPQQSAKQHLLLIDDDETTHELVRRYLSDLRIAVHSAYDGPSGVRKARELQPDIILLDVIMPGVDGWEVLNELKADPNTAGIPLLVVSILAEEKAAFELGAQEYLVKPIERRRLQEILEKYRTSGTPRVLVVEDDESLRELLTRKIEREGWETAGAVNGEDAVRVLEQGFSPDLILLDLMMPGMDGFQFLQVARERSEWADIPVVVVTAMELTSAQREGLRRHVEKIVEKNQYSTEDMLGYIAGIVQDTLDVRVSEK